MVLVLCTSLLCGRRHVTLMCVHRKEGIQAVCADRDHQTNTQRMARVPLSIGDSHL